MKRLSFVVLSAFVLALGLSVYAEQTQSAPAAAPASPAPARPTVAPAASHAPAAITESQTALVKQYCATCHNDRNKNNAGGLSLAAFDAAKVGHDAQVAEVAEKMIRKLRSG